MPEESPLNLDAVEDEPTILIVDDNYALLEVLHEHLEMWGYRPLSTTKGSEAKALLSQRRFDVVLADLRMSPVSGWEVIEEAKSHPGTEVIVMTGYASLDSSLEAFRHRAYDFLEKPIDFKRLERTLRNAVRQSRLTTQSTRKIEDSEARIRFLETEVARLRGELEEKGLRDEATGVLNQRPLLEILHKEINRGMRHNHPLTLVSMQIDRIEKVDEVFGPTGVEEALRQVADILLKELRTSDFVGRYRGNGFAVLLPETEKEPVEAHLAKIVRRVHERHLTDGGSDILTLSVGVAGFPEDGRTRDELLKSAHQALQTATFRGGNCVVLA
jgi:diguanylate cyclase (GGDEF)-like protein